jgi:hypothetical protein
MKKVEAMTIAVAEAMRASAGVSMVFLSHVVFSSLFPFRIRRDKAARKFPPANE